MLEGEMVPPLWEGAGWRCPGLALAAIIVPGHGAERRRTGMLGMRSARRGAAWVALGLMVLSLLSVGVAAWAGDPDGSKTGDATDVVGATNNSPTATDLRTAAQTTRSAAE